jgi:chromosome segregation ATPase
MGYLLVLGFTTTIIAVVSFGYFKWLKKKVINYAQSEVFTLTKELSSIKLSIESELIDPNSYGSKEQLNFLSSKLLKINQSIENERDRLKKFEEQLDFTLKDVEEHEVKIQNLKTASQQENTYLSEISKEFERLAKEASELESNLSESLSEIDKIEAELDLTPEQQEQFNLLKQSIVEANKRLEELVNEFAEVEKRIKLLNQQFLNLEEEYAKLVEEQFN